MSGTRVLGDIFEATEGGLKLKNRLAKTKRTPIAFVSGETEESFTMKASATIKRVILEMPAFANAVVTGAIKIENSDGVAVYEKTGMAEDETHVRTTNESMVGENTVTVTLSEDPLGSGTCYVTLYLEGN